MAKRNRPKSPFKFPLRPHEDNGFIVVDADGKQLALCGVHGDIDNNGNALAQRFADAVNEQAGAYTAITPDPHKDVCADQINRLAEALGIEETDPEEIVSAALRIAHGVSDEGPVNEASEAEA